MNGDTLAQRYEAFDQLATMVAIARSDGHCLLANSTLENALAVSRRALLRGSVLDWFSATR
jgi:two-component system nitrogen regulation sensor histidine kinase GlnL